MLRGALVALTVCVLFVGLVAQPASAAEPECIKTDPSTGFCSVWAEEAERDDGPEGSGEGNGDDDQGSSDGQGDGRLTIDGRECWYTGVADPQPPKEYPVWGSHTDGAIHECSEGPCQRFCVPATIQFWAAEAPEAPEPPDPAELAEQALAQMNLRAIEIGIVPEDKSGSVGIVGMPQWMWAEHPGRNTMGPITRTATAGNFSVTATAAVDKIVWDMGDGTTVTCTGPGTPYEDKHDDSDSPDCGHRYTRQGEYTVTATSYWTVQWRGVGDTGIIEDSLVSSTDIVMGEAQVITQ